MPALPGDPMEFDAPVSGMVWRSPPFPPLRPGRRVESAESGPVQCSIGGQPPHRPASPPVRLLVRPPGRASRQGAHSTFVRSFVLPFVGPRWALGVHHAGRSGCSRSALGVGSLGARGFDSRWFAGRSGGSLAKVLWALGESTALRRSQRPDTPVGAAHPSARLARPSPLPPGRAVPAAPRQRGLHIERARLQHSPPPPEIPGNARRASPGTDVLSPLRVP